jgi:hypothetical protein
MTNKKSQFRVPYGKEKRIASRNKKSVRITKRRGKEVGVHNSPINLKVTKE